MEVSGPVDMDVRRLHTGGGLHPDLQAQLFHGLPGQQGDQPVQVTIGGFASNRPLITVSF